ncbi:MAG: hypothetical protein VW362_07580, partial [Candidatus Nanopelagicales bacterium]
KIGPVNQGRCTGTQVLWELDQDYTWENYNPGLSEIDRTTRYVVTSATVAPFSGPETYIFPSDSEGNIVNFGELPGSFMGGLDHQEAIDGLCKENF